MYCTYLDVTREMAVEEIEKDEPVKEQPLSAPTTPTAPPMPEGLYPILENLENMSPNNGGNIQSPAKTVHPVKVHTTLHTYYTSCAITVVHNLVYVNGIQQILVNLPQFPTTSVV